MVSSVYAVESNRSEGQWLWESGFQICKRKVQKGKLFLEMESIVLSCFEVLIVQVFCLFFKIFFHRKLQFCFSYSTSNEQQLLL